MEENRFKGITLNMQQIDLLSIVTADENSLINILNNISNLSEEQKQSVLASGKSIAEIKRIVFKMYQDSLTNYMDTNFSLDGNGKQRELEKSINFVLNNAHLNQEQQRQFIDVIRNNELSNIPRIIRETFDEQLSDIIFSVLSRYMPTEKEGIKETTYEAFERLADHLSEYQLINLDDIAKYSHYVRKDGKYNREDLIKAFNFARSHNMQVRLNTLLFYMDTPLNLENMPYEQGKIEAKKLLENYVEDITSVIAKYNNDCIQRGEKPTVRTVEIFNELLNRFAMNGNVTYDYRGHIDTDEHRINTDNPNYDDLRAGWLRFFEIEDLCSIMEIARRNLPNVNLMINECTLEDSRKIEPFKRLIIDKIKNYEEQHGIKLIDSIGTQMHINSSTTKDEIRMMFENLSQFGLPIEVTEFDMAIDQDFINSHSQEEIEAFKKQKISDFYDVIAEIQEKANVKGVTIWSVSDLQNYVIHIINQKIYKENIERQKNGLELIPYVKTLYGGYYNANMEDITIPKTKGFSQEFNYHTHTYRSGHSEYVSDEEMLEAAKKAGITMLGFSEHIPNPDLVLPDEDHRMLFSEVEEYISSINKLKQEHPEMTILAGFEAEYDPMKEAYLGEMRDKVDYMVLGQHFVNRGLQKTTPENNPNYPIEYANMVIKALESGIFDIVAHPDCFMKFRDTMTDENKKLFEENAIIASQVICEKARDMGIPIEINLSQDRILSDGKLTYPHPTFWKVASEIEGLKVLKGIDSHSISSFEKTKETNEQITDIEQMISDKLIRGKYNPVIARNNNIKLKEAYKNGQNNALTFETHMITNIVDASLSSVGDSDSESITVTIGNSLNKTIENCSLSAKEKEKSTAKDLSDIAESKKLSTAEIKGKLDRKKKTLEETKKVLSNQQRALNGAKNSVITAMNIGCQNKDEYSNIITQITQYNTTNNETQKVQIEEHINSFQQSKLGGNTHGQSEGQSKALVRFNPNIPKKNGNDSQNVFNSSGYINIFILILILLLAVCFGIGMGYLIYKFKI